jgi:hypothetical protein
LTAEFSSSYDQCPSYDENGDCVGPGYFEEDDWGYISITKFGLEGVICDPSFLENEVAEFDINAQAYVVSFNKQFDEIDLSIAVR